MLRRSSGLTRRIQLFPRAIVVLKRQLRLRARLEAAERIDRDHVCFLESGEPMRSLHDPQVRWRKTLRSLKLRYRRPYTARHSSVSWNLMIGKNALWVTKRVR
jgi:integrase